MVLIWLLSLTIIIEWRVLLTFPLFDDLLPLCLEGWVCVGVERLDEVVDLDGFGFDCGVCPTVRTADCLFLVFGPALPLPLTDAVMAVDVATLAKSQRLKKYKAS